MNELQFPIGKYKSIKSPDSEVLQSWVNTIASFPSKLKVAVKGLTQDQLLFTYRANSWTIKQLVHHVADSHMNAFMRFKLAITEDKPIIKPYFEAEWAKLPDYKVSIESSILIVEGVHSRWIELLNGMSKTDFTRTYIHPEFNKEYDLTEALCQYDWHCRHHLAHIELAKK
ncbi:MAG: putative metal-dependent hydrolase [Cyclobacteriaceae bacterium]|nr:putative metal-dependent hydrolase [Cyclobacteriaceae bacterium]